MELEKIIRRARPFSAPFRVASGERFRLKRIDPAAVTSRAALALLPVLRKSELPALHKAAPPFGGFVAEPPNEPVDIVYLCFPNNPTGAVATRAQLEKWVAYAQKHKAILLYDAAYEGYISEPGIPRSIFEIPGAMECSVEFRSFSKTGGFTGVRCGFTVMTKSLLAQTTDGRELPVHKLWHRRWSTKANGVSYPVQRGAEALYSPAGREQVRGLVDHYMGNARILSAAASRAGLRVYGGKNAPYIWVATPPGLTSWQMFDRMLHDLNVVITPGSGFGSEGEGYFRISAFNSRANAEEVARRLETASFS